MTDSRNTIVYRRTDEAGTIYGVPDIDLTQADIDRLPAILHREIRLSRLFEAAELTPAQKAALTRAENQRRGDEEEAARLAAEQRAADEQAAKDAADAANQTGDGTGDQDGER